MPEGIFNGSISRDKYSLLADDVYNSHAPWFKVNGKVDTLLFHFKASYITSDYYSLLPDNVSSTIAIARL